MEICVDSLKKWKDAPKRGWALIYTRTQIKLEKYDEFNKDEKLKGDILEIHLFDQEKEYRLVISRNKRYPSGIIEHISDFSYLEGEAYLEKIQLEPACIKEVKIEEITVINHISYDKNGMASVDDYRLCMEG